MNLHVFHLLQSVSRHTADLDVGVPARGLHGEAYRGTCSGTSSSCFRSSTSGCPTSTGRCFATATGGSTRPAGPRERPGIDGAMFPWQSGSDGREETQRIHLNPRSGRWNPDAPRLQRHVNAAIAYNVWQYYQVTDDLEFLAVCRRGDDHRDRALLGEHRHATTSPRPLRDPRRDGSGRVPRRLPGADGAGLDNNAYTNVMAVWVLWRALDVLEVLSPRSHARSSCERLGLGREEIERWDEISRKMRLVLPR